jgi:hypothetical protein
MRPKSIVLFERLALLSILLGVIGTYLLREQTQAALEAQGTPIGANTVLVIQAVTIAIYLLLVYFIARKGSPIAKWIYVALGALSIVTGLIGVGQTFALGAVAGAMSLVQIAIGVATIWLLFRPDAKAWFSEGRGDDA